MRKLIERFFDKHEVSWEVFMIVLAIVFVVIGYLPDYMDFSPESLDVLDNLDLGITAFFALEFIIRLLIASSRKGYLKGHWLDLIAIMPVVRWLRFFRVARILRLLRLARLVRVLNSFDRFELAFFPDLPG